VVPLARRCFFLLSHADKVCGLARQIQTADAWIAASAIYYQVPLITGNKLDYEIIDGLSLLSE
jgi:predicted nucleic acid-binding protein